MLPIWGQKYQKCTNRELWVVVHHNLLLSCTNADSRALLLQWWQNTNFGPNYPNIVPNFAPQNLCLSGTNADARGLFTTAPIHLKFGAKPFPKTAQINVKKLFSLFLSVRMTRKKQHTSCCFATGTVLFPQYYPYKRAHNESCGSIVIDSYKKYNMAQSRG